MDKKSKTPKEKRRNNEKRKEKSRDAARSRRSRETEIFTDLGNVLPVSSEQISQLDKASVMRLAISYLRVRDMIQSIPILPVKEKLRKNLREETVFLKALDGFVLVVSSEGDFIYLSENVNEYLGITQIDLMGQNVYEYSHPCDHDELKDLLASKSQDDTDDPKSIFIRLKCTLTSKGRSVNLKSASFKVIHCTGHMIKDKSLDDDEKKGRISTCLVAVGQPIPHPSNIDTPLPRQTFLTKHSMDMKFTHADDEFMIDLLGYTAEDLIGKSVYEYHHAMDSDSIESAYKCLFSKGQCETNRYRFLAKTGGYVWVVTQATLILDKMQKPQSVVCVNYVISGVECKHEIYAAHQLACVKSEISSSTSSILSEPDDEISIIPQEVLIPPKILIEDVDVDDNNSNISIDSAVNDIKNSDPESDNDVIISLPVIPIVKTKPISVTAKLFSSINDSAKEHPEIIISRPHTATKTIFAPRTEDMSKGFLTFSEEEPGLTMLKDEPDDLTHLAPVAGDVCIPLDDNPFINEMLDDFLLKDTGFGPLLTDEPPSDPFFSYRNYKDCSPQLLSPNLSKNSDCSLPSLSSPNSSLLDEDQMSTFMNLQMDDEPDLIMRAPFIPMHYSDDLPLLMETDLMWNSNEKSCSKNSSRIGSSVENNNNSTLAQMLESSMNKSTQKGTDRGGGTVEDTNSDILNNNNDKNSDRCWSSSKINQNSESDSIVKLNRSTTNLKRANNSKHEKQQSKRIKNESSKNEKMSSELLHQLMSHNNHHQRGRPKNKNNWLLDTGGKAACISQPSESVLMNLLDSKDCSEESASSASQLDSRIEMKLMDIDYSKFTARKKILQQKKQEKNRLEKEARRFTIRKNSLSLLEPETTSVPSLLDLTQQDCEVNAPVNSSLLQGEELLIALDINQNI